MTARHRGQHRSQGNIAPCCKAAAQDPQPGDRVELIRCNDPWTRLSSGSQGTVGHVDDAGTVHVRWDSGSTLGLVADDGDEYRVIRRLEDVDPKGDLL